MAAAVAPFKPEETQRLLSSEPAAEDGGENGQAPAQLQQQQAFSFSGLLQASFGTLPLYIIYFAACSSTMLIINKVAIENVSAPAFVMLCQMGCSAAVACLGGAMGWFPVDALEYQKVTRFMLVVVGFLGCVFCNIKVLQNSNVETFITFRSSTPLLLTFCDFWFLGRELPSTRSWGCLLVLLAGAVGYVCTDTGFQVHAYYWLAAWYCFFIFDAVYIKYTCDTVKMTNWGRVYYTNFLTLPFLIALVLGLQEVPKLMAMTWGVQALLPLFLSCMVGVCMSHSAYLLRDACSATLFTVVGIVCKVISVIINWLMWDKHTSKEGLAFLLLCVLAGTFYQQAPMRPKPAAEVVASSEPIKG